MSSQQRAGAGASPPAAAAAPSNVGVITMGGIVTVVTIFVLFLAIAFGISSVHYCLNFFDRRTRGASPTRRRPNSAAAVRTARTRGVDPALLRSLPVTVYRAKADDAAEVECAVCLAALEDGEAARFLPRCGHGFHAECVDTWLASHTTCPLCRLTVAKPDATPPPAPALAPVLPEPANYAASANLPASVLLGIPSHQVAAAAPAADRVFATATLVIEIPEPAAPTTFDAAKSPGSARLRSIRRLWSFGRQGAGPSCSSCSCAGGSERADVEEQSISVTIDIAVAEAPSKAAGGAVRGASA